MGRVMALDVGDVRIGVALSDPMKIIASPFESYTRHNDESDFLHFQEIITQNDVELVIVGLPLSMSGEENEQVKKTRIFVEELLKYIQIEIKFQDERLTSVSANRVLLEADMSRKKRKTVVDKVAATFILSSYLNLN